MFLYLIELYIAGVLLFHLLNSKLPSAIQAVSGILLGYLLHVLNSMALIGVGIGLTQTSVVILISVECLGFLIGLIVKQKSVGQLRKVFSLGFWVVGLIYFGLLYIFYKLNPSLITNDSLYLILYGQDLVQSGFSEWYFASPASMGIYIGLIQAMGMLFGLDYVWFVQPILSIILIAAFIYFGHKSVSRYLSEKWIAIVLVIGAVLLFVTSNLPYAMMVYLHTNMSSGLFLFLTIASLYFAIEEDNESWLVLGGLSLISFGLMRIENVLMALLLVFIYLSSGKMSQKQSALTFFPSLLIFGFWYFSVYFMDINTFLGSMDKAQILLISAASFGLVFVILLSRWRILKWILDWSGKLLPFILLVAWIVLGFLNPSQAIINLRAISTNLFISGNWGSFWYAALVLILISVFIRRFPQKGILLSFLVSFVSIVEILGFFRHPYHNQWYDSANRMMIHIAPLVLFFVITQVAKASSLSKALPEADETPKVV